MESIKPDTERKPDTADSPGGESDASNPHRSPHAGRQPSAQVLLAAAGMALFVVSNGNWIVPVAAWVAPVFLLRFVRMGRPVVVLPALFVLVTIAARMMLDGIIPSLLGFLAYVLTVYYAVLWTFPYIADRLIAPHIKGFLSTLVFPAAAVSAEYINNVLFGSWASVAYTQLDHLALVQIGSVSGIWASRFWSCGSVQC